MTIITGPTAPSTADPALELPARAAELLDLLRKNAGQTETDRRVVEENIEALASAGLFKIAVPKRFGGHEADFATFLKVTSTLGQACGSTAWVTTLANVSGWMVGLFPDQAQREVYESDSEARICGVLAPSSSSVAAEGGLRVTGKWGFASGSLHSQWALLGVPVVDDAGVQTDQGLALIPMTELGIQDTWHVVGLRGTGSHTLVAEDVFVPAHRIVSLTQLVEGNAATEYKDEALYRSAVVPVAALVLVGPLLGLAKGARDHVLNSLGKGKGISYTFYDRATDSGSTQINVAQAASLIDTAELHIFRAAEDIDKAAASGEYMEFKTRARVRMDVGVAATRCREAMDLLLSVHGAGSFAEANQLQQKWRDLETGSRHAVISPAISSEAYGRSLLGVKEQVTPLI